METTTSSLIIGQDKLIKTINSYTVSSFPMAVILSGEYGCGKHTVCKYIQDKFSFDVLLITTKEQFEYIELAESTANPTLYIISADDLSTQRQNAILKLIEEPPIGVHIIIMCEIYSQLLPTICGRCQIWTFAPYTQDILQKFIPNEESKILDVCKTPGQIKELQDGLYDKYSALAETIVEKIGTASITNTLSLVDKLNYTSEYQPDTISVVLFAKILINSILKFIRKDVTFSYSKYAITDKFIIDISNPQIDKKRIFTKFLIDFKLLTMSENRGVIK